MSGNIAITGAPTQPGPNGSVPLRREIRDLQANFPDQWNLYLLGLQALQNVDNNDMQSYYQVAGIHGMPYSPWDGVDGISDFSYGGYCTHTSVIFLTWHRPYLGLYEQALYAQIQKIANSFPDSLKAKYQAAAQTFRIPYWDWAARPAGVVSAFPPALTTARIGVIGTDGKPTSIDNPLYTFNFPQSTLSDGEIGGVWANFPNTLRWPDSNNQSDNGSVASAVFNESASIRSGASLILLSYKEFNTFSNDNWQQDGSPGSYSSLEGLHNGIHVDVGGTGDQSGNGQGHMSQLDVSAFDPAFWLHHTNVDRLWSIWQALNPNSFVQPGFNGTGNFTTEPQTTEGPDTPLKPFWNQTGTDFWTSTPVKESTVFGYAYPETQSWNFGSQAQYQQNVRQTVAKLYGGNSVAEFFANRKAGVPSMTQLVQRKAVVHPAQAPLPKAAAPAPAPTNPSSGAAKANPQPDVLEGPQPPAKDEHPLVHDDETLANAVPSEFSHLLKDNKYTEWLCNIRAIKHGLDSTFRVLVFLGDFNSDPRTWPFEPNMVGGMTALDRSPASECAKCKSDRLADLTITGQVSLTAALLEDIVQGKLRSLEQADVESYLEKNLHWRVLKTDGTEEPRDSVPGLKVSVCSTQVSVGEGGVPEYSGQYVMHPNITDGRPAGHSPGDQI